jgi:hypothetical protein
LPNKYLGLARGPIDHQSSSVINSIADGPIEMGSGVILKDINTIVPIPAELLPRVEEGDAQLGTDIYGIAVGGDNDGIYSPTGEPIDDTTKATTGAGQGVVVVTQGRCLARVDDTTAILVGSALGAGIGGIGILELADDASQHIIAIALQPVVQGSGDTHIIAVDVQREGLNT